MAPPSAPNCGGKRGWPEPVLFQCLLASDSIIIRHWNNLHTNFGSKFFPRNQPLLPTVLVRLQKKTGHIFKIQIWIIFGFPASLLPKLSGSRSGYGSLTFSYPISGEDDDPPRGPGCEEGRHNAHKKFIFKNCSSKVHLPTITLIKDYGNRFENRPHSRSKVGLRI